jgi:hypothetical protein
MRSVLGLFSVLALGLLAAGVLAVVGNGPLTRLGSGGAGDDGFVIDHASLLLGLALGVVISTLARISWAELPRRAVAWLMANERNFARLAWAGVLVAILLFY